MNLHIQKSRGVEGVGFLGLLPLKSGREGGREGRKEGSLYI
jgi:hypothetical protein